MCKRNVGDTANLIEVQQQLEEVLSEMEHRQREHRDLAVQIHHIQQRLDEPSTAPCALDTSNNFSIQKMQERQNMLIEERFRQQDHRVSEALRSVIATATLESQESAASTLTCEGRVTSLSKDFAATSARVDGLVAQIEKHSEQLESLLAQRDKSAYSQSCMLNEQWQRQGQGFDDRRHRDSWNSASLQDTVSGPRSVELQLHDLVQGLRKLELRDAKGTSSPRRGADLECTQVLNDLPMVLKELHEERGRIADMLDGVKVEKLEVIAMMHSFHMDKSEALKELETIWQTARAELAESARKASIPQPTVAPSQVASSPAPQSVCPTSPVTMSRSVDGLNRVGRRYVPVHAGVLGTGHAGSGVDLSDVRRMEEHGQSRPLRPILSPRSVRR